jgi:integrase
MSVYVIISESGEKSYQVRVKDANRKHYPSKTFDKKSEADNYNAELISRRAKGAKVLPGIKYTLNEYWDKWNVERGINWGKSVRRDTEGRFRNYIAPALGSMLLTEIDSSAIARLMVDLKNKGLSASTRNNLHGSLNRMFKDAVNFYGILLSNPVRDDHRSKTSKKERPHWTPQQCYRLLDSVREHEYGVAFWIMIWNGLRIGEILGLRHGDIDLDSGVFHIKRQFSKNEYVFKELKNRVEYSPKIAPALLDFLRDKLSKDADPNALVIMGRSGRAVGKYDTIVEELTLAAKKVGLRRLTPHELRHSMTGLWEQVGATERDLQKLMNHKSTVSTRGYMHQTSDRMDMLAERLAQLGKNVLVGNFNKKGSTDG